MSQPNMSKVDMATLTVVQEVLRGVLVSLAKTNAIDAEKVARAIQSFVADPGLEPTSEVMLLDLAGGMEILGKIQRRGS